MPAQPILQQRHRNQINDVALCWKSCRAAYVFVGAGHETNRRKREKLKPALGTPLSEGGPRVWGHGPGPFSQFLNSGGDGQKNAAGIPLSPAFRA